MSQPVNGYCDLDTLKQELSVTTDDVVDDSVLGDCITDASRAIDAFCDRMFYASAVTKVYDCPVDGDSVLRLNGDDWVEISSITNGDGSVIAGSSPSIQVWPLNYASFTAVRLRPSSGLAWAPLDGDYIGAITVSGSAGYVNRSASDAESQRIVSNTRRAATILAIALYRKRHGMGVEAAQVTAAGVILTPAGMPRDVVDLIVGYRRNF